MTPALSPSALAPRPSSRRVLLQTVSLSALLAAGLAPAESRAAPFRSLQAALAQGARASAATAAIAPSVGITAAKQAQLGAQNLAAASARFASLGQALAAAGHAAAAPNVPDGYGSNAGLQLGDGVGTPALDGSIHVANPALWSGAEDATGKILVGQTASATGTTVTVTQTKPLAQLTWKSFDVGAHTTLKFDQSAGGSLATSWVVINKLQDAATNPSEILGAIQAPGKVYVINRNGIAFGRGATINVGSLIAATANIAQSQFSTDAAGNATFNLYGGQSGNQPIVPTFAGGLAASAVTVDAGASIATPKPSGNAGGGYVMLFGGYVENDGSITTPQGQTVLAAGTNFALRPGYSPSANTTSTTLGSEVSVTGTAPGGGTAIGQGAVTNSSTGLIFADQGDISLVGHSILQDGVLMSTTTVNTRGTVHLLTDLRDSSAGIILGPHSLTEILPLDDGQTALDSQRASNVATSTILNALRSGNAQNTGTQPLNDISTLADQFGNSRIELSSGGNVDVQSGALALTPGGQVAIGAAGRVLLESNSTIDVSGSNSALLPASINDLMISVQPYQLRDSAGNRTGPLKSTTLFVDARTLVQTSFAQTPGAPGNIYTPGGLLEVGGYVGLVPHGITEWTASGGQVILQASSTGTDSITGSKVALGQVITQPGSVINLSGGTIGYQAGPVQQSYLIASTGAVYNANYAPGNLVYTGVYDGTQVTHPRWNVTQTYNNPLLTPPVIYDPAYTVGRDAGTLTVNAPTAVLQGAVPAGVTLGEFQNAARPATVTDPYILAQSVVPLAGTFQYGNYIAGLLTTTGASAQFNTQYASAVSFQTTQTGSAPSRIATPLDPLLLDTVTIDAPQFSADGFANIAAITNGTVRVEAPVTVADGGTLTLDGQVVQVDSDLTARGGAINLANLVTQGTLTAVLGSPGQTAPTPGARISLATGVTLDARGLYTNEVLDPVHIADVGLANGGRVNITSYGAVLLPTTSRIDVSAGGAQLSVSKQLAASGGSVSISADYIPVTGTVSPGPISLGATFAAYGGKGGGTLAITAPDIVLGPASIDAPLSTFFLPPATLSSGFSNYVLNGLHTLDVLPGAQITVVEPVAIFTNSLAVPTGGDPSSAYSIVLPDLFTPVPGTDRLTKRLGASLTLTSILPPTLSAVTLLQPTGSLLIGAAATVQVDPGQSIVAKAGTQATVYGTLTATGGTVEVATTSAVPARTTDQSTIGLAYVAGRSVWIGDGAVLDTSGYSASATDAAGRRYGTLSAGGTIILGGDGGLVASGATTDAQVLVRPGATLDASGASLTVDVMPGTLEGTLQIESQPVDLASDGGTIVARSQTGIVLDGTMRAQAGGTGASGGALVLRNDLLPVTVAYANVPPQLFQPQLIAVSNHPVRLASNGLAPGQPTPDYSIGLARISQDQIAAGGFAQLTLAGDVVFDGSVNLALSRSLTLGGGLVSDALPNQTVTISAPYVQLNNLASATGTAGYGTLGQGGKFEIDADLIDLQSNVAIQRGEYVNTAISPASTLSTYGFANVTLDSTGDIRLLGASFSVDSDLTLIAAQVYPTTSTTNTLTAGFDVSAQPGTDTLVNPYAGGSITIERASASTPASPYSVGGLVQLNADTVVQDGVLRAPEGQITLGIMDSPNAGFEAHSTRVTLGAASITSVSLDGQTIPYGGTVDGSTYVYDNNPVGTFSPQVTINAQTFFADPASTLDISGGGTLSGAAFIPGRGGSVDVLKTPLLNISGGALANTADQVFAILPGYTAAYAPVAPDDANYASPGIGRQITVGANVPGLPAGTYTLLPAYYALLPGAYRVELTAGTAPAGTAASIGNFTTVAPVTLGVANTGIAATTPIAALFTDGAGTRLLAQYNEEDYSSFEIAQAANFGTPRPFLPQDAKTVSVVYPQDPGQEIKFSLDAASLLQAPATDGRGATLEISSNSNQTALAPIDIIGDGGIAPAGSVGIEASVLSALNVPRLVLGGTLLQKNAADNTIYIVPTSSSITVAPDAVLTAGDVLLTTISTGKIDIQSTLDAAGNVTAAATISTLGHGSAAYDLSNGFYFNYGYDVASPSPVLDVSNGQVVFVPTSVSPNSAQILVGDGVNLLAGGSLDFVAPFGTSVGIGQASLGAKYLSLNVAALNIGTQDSLAAVANKLPTGFSIDQTVFSTLLGGDKALGIPAVSQLLLTATQETNFIGSVALDSGSTAFVLNTPAIYGYGAATDAVSITAPSFTWSGVSLPTFSFGTQTGTIPATPGGQIRGSTQNTIGSLTVNTTGAVTFGYGPQTQPDDQSTLTRLVSGFGTVTFRSASEITANNQSALSVYQSIQTFGSPGTGGDLVLDAPLVTTDSAAVLKLTAGGALTVMNSSGAAASTGSVVSQGGEIDFSAASIADTGGTVLLPAGRLTATAQGDIALAPGVSIDLAGRTTQNFDQSVNSQGGTLLLESTSGSISDAAAIDISAPGNNAGAVSLSALQGQVDISGTIAGTAGPGDLAGQIGIIAGSLPGGDTALAALDTLLDAGGVDGSRRIEVASGNLLLPAGQTLTAHTVALTADTGAITIDGTIDASGRLTGAAYTASSIPGSIALSAGGNVTLDATAVLNASTNGTALDSYGAPIDAENRAHVTLTSSAGSLILAGGATIDVSYPLSGSNPQGEVVLNAPRLGADNVAAFADTGTVSIDGAQSVSLFAFRSYDTSGDANNNVTVVQGASSAGTLGLGTIGDDNTAYMNAVDANGAAIVAQLAGIDQVQANGGSAFHLAPGVEIGTTQATGDACFAAASCGNITVSGDLDFSGLRYSDPTGFGRAIVSGVEGSGEAGSIVFRAANQLTVNGSISDGFAHPPDAAVAQANGATSLPQDSGWQYFFTPKGFGLSPNGADQLLPASTIGTFADSTTTTQIVLHGATGGPVTEIPTGRAISLNYGITIRPANVLPNTVLPFGAELGASTRIPAGGWIATADILTAPPNVPRSQVMFAKGQFLPAGTLIKQGYYLTQGTVLPRHFQLADRTYVPAGTLLSIFASGKLDLRLNTSILPANAFIPSGTKAVFSGISPTDGSVERLASVALRPSLTDQSTGFTYQGLLYPIAPVLPAGDISWSLNLVAGANAASADRLAVKPRSALDAPSAFGMSIYQAPGSLVLDDQHYATLPMGDGTDNNNYATIRNAIGQDAFSVIRTGTGDLNLVAGGNVDQSSLYGVYTSGRQVQVDAVFQSARTSYGTNGALLKGDFADPAFAALNALVTASYQANYATAGGDVLLSAQGDISSDTYLGYNNNPFFVPPGDAVGNWLWRQGSPSSVGSFSIQQPVSWWLDYGTFSSFGPGFIANPYLLGFQGVGALGGGNVTVEAGGSAAQSTLRGGVGNSSRGEGLVIAVGATGRDVANTDGTTSLVQTGGGRIAVDVAGAFADGPGALANTTIVNLRGDTTIDAGAIGQIKLNYGGAAFGAADPRSVDPFKVVDGTGGGGLTIVPGDGGVNVATLRDLVLATSLDPGLQPQTNSTLTDAVSNGATASAAGTTSFSLWTANTSVSLFSAGGNVTPITTLGTTTLFSTDLYPATLNVTAASGDIIYGSSSEVSALTARLETSPSPTGQIEFLAAGSIFANDLPVDLSGQDPLTTARPADPAISLSINQRGNIAGFLVDTPTTDLHANDPQPARFYAATGDIVNFISGEALSLNNVVTYLAAKPVWVLAGNDIVNSGTRPSNSAGVLDPSAAEFAIQTNFVTTSGAAGGGVSSGNVFLNTDPNSISVVSAGRDILSSYFYVGGPGLLEVDAGRNINQTGQSLLQYGSIKSIGSLISGAAPSLSGGAGIAVLAGIGAGPDYTAFETAYLTPSNMADLALPITDPANKGKVQLVYTAQLLAWLQTNYGYTGTEADALAYFNDDANLSQTDRDVFLREIFFDETVASGRQFNDPTSRFFGSYVRGRQAIDTLFPSTPPNADNATGVPVGYTGSIVMASGLVPNGFQVDAGIATLHGGDVQALDPGGEILLGTQGGVAPGAGSGIVTFGSGTIDVYALDSILLGRSRIFTTAGGDIAIWSSQGDINAGVGAKTTVVFSPPTIIYDKTGGLTLQPTVPTNGAGIATLAPIAGITAGNIDLTAPLGTIDAGEAGIRVSGNLNLAALHLANTANIAVGGKTAGTPSFTAPSITAVSAASSTAGATTAAADDTRKKKKQEENTTIIEVEVISITGGDTEDKKRRRPGI